MKKTDEKVERIKETFLIPADVDRVLEELPARIKLDTGPRSPRPTWWWSS